MLNLQPASFDHKRNRGPLTPRSRSRSLPQPPRSCGPAATTHRPACRGAAGPLPRGPPLRKARPLSPARGGSFRPTHNTLRAQNPHKKKLRKPQNEPPTRKPYPVSEKLDKFLAFLSIRDNQGAKRRGQNPLYSPSFHIMPGQTPEDTKGPNRWFRSKRPKPTRWTNPWLFCPVFEKERRVAKLSQPSDAALGPAALASSPPAPASNLARSGSPTFRAPLACNPVMPRSVPQRSRAARHTRTRHCHPTARRAPANPLQ